MLLAPRTEMQCILESHSAFCLFIEHVRSDMCGNLPATFAGYVIFEGLLMFLGKRRNVEFRNYSTVYCLIFCVKYGFMKAGLCSQFFCSYCLF